MSALFDVRPVAGAALGSLAAQKAVFRTISGEEPEVLWTAFLEVVDAHGLYSIAAATFIREVGKRVR